MRTKLLGIIRQILEKKWQYVETVRQLFIAFKTAYDIQLGGKYCAIFS
jgi:hypothetical protein